MSLESHGNVVQLCSVPVELVRSDWFDRLVFSDLNGTQSIDCVELSSISSCSLTLVSSVLVVGACPNTIAGNLELSVVRQQPPIGNPTHLL